MELIKNRIFVTIILIVNFFQGVNAQWNSFIRNFGSNELGKGAQIWDIETYDQKWVYLANQNGMLQYDGMEWEIYPLHESQYVRSVLLSSEDGRVYVGGINEFGYFAPQENGKLSYVCMSDSLPMEVRRIGNVWNVCRLTSGIYFQGDNKIVRCYDNGKSSVIDAHLKIECSLMLDDVIYLGTERGIYIIAGNDIFPMQGGEILSDRRIRCMSRFGHGIIIGLETGELYYSDKKSITPYITNGEKLLEKTGIFRIAATERYIAIGTIQSGIVLIDNESGDVRHFDESNGMQNNTVLSLSFDKIGNLWAGLDKGTDYIYLNIPFSNLYNTMSSCGTGYAAIEDGERLLFGTNRGLYQVPHDSSMRVNARKLKLIGKTTGQVWGLKNMNGDVICLHDRGMLVVRDTIVEQVPGIVGAWDCQPVMGEKDKYYVGTYDGLYVVKRENGQYSIKNRVSGIDDSFQNYIQESATMIWLHMGNDANVRCITLSDDMSRVTKEVRYDAGDGLPECEILDIERIGTRIYCTTETGIYKFNHHTNRFESASEFNKAFGRNKKILRLTNHGERISAVSEDEISVASYELNTFQPLYRYSIQRSLISLVDNFAGVYPIADTLLVLPTDDGFALLNPQRAEGSPKHHHLFKIKKVSTTNNRDSVIYYDNFTGKKPKPVFGFEENSIRFEYNAVAICSENILYSTRMNSGEWSEPSRMMSKEYSDLKEGRYIFEVKAIFNNEGTIVESFEFEILPPWYRSIWAYLSYALIIMSLLYFIGKAENRRLLKREERIVLEKDQEMQSQQRVYELEKEQQERHIMELEKEKLEYDLKHKSQEMTNLMINLARKNEMLSSIKEDITKVVASLRAGESKESYRQLLAISSQIDQNMQDDDMLKRIEEQFDLVHNNFIKKLSERHPDLSNNERMMCAYLKMNLSTKEIAPLLNISVRGVETMRYRLRKKLGLEREDGLMAYLSEQFK